jgi:hypothetical protein
VRHALKNLSRTLDNPIVGWSCFILTCLAIAILTNFGPAEHSLGTNIRIVYLHGAWVWVALTAFIISGICGVIGLITKRRNIHTWSMAFGRTGVIFWVTYLPLSLWAMQSNWNGLFLVEPRWKLALVFAITGILLQIGLSLADKPNLTSAINLGYFILLFLAIDQTENVMHPTSPILNSESWHIQVFFFSLMMLILFAAWQVARWWVKLESDRLQQ